VPKNQIESFQTFTMTMNLLLLSSRTVSTAAFSLVLYSKKTARICLQNDYSRCFSTRDERQAIRDKERADKKARREARATRDEETRTYLKMVAQPTAEQVKLEIEKRKEHEEQQMRLRALEVLWARERAAILAEVAAMTRILYRTCLKSVKLMRPGNGHDEIEFRRLEAEQASRWERALKDSLDGIGSMVPIVDRPNELESRYNYYNAHVKERFKGDFGILDRDPWTEDCVERFLLIFREGEAARKWVLEDYKFVDQFPNRLSEERTNQLQERMRKLVKDVYRGYGWQLESERVYECAGEIDIFGSTVEAPATGKTMHELREGARHMSSLELERNANVTSS